MKTHTCNRCGESGLVWNQTRRTGRFFLATAMVDPVHGLVPGAPHSCEQHLAYLAGVKAQAERKAKALVDAAAEIEQCAAGVLWCIEAGDATSARHLARIAAHDGRLILEAQPAL